MNKQTELDWIKAYKKDIDNAKQQVLKQVLEIIDKMQKEEDYSMEELKAQLEKLRK